MRHVTIKLRMTVWFTLFMLTLSVLMLVFIMLMSRDRVSGTPEAEVVKVVERNVGKIDIEHGQLDLHRVDYCRREVYTQLFLDDGTLLGGACPSGVQEELPLLAGAVRTAHGSNGTTTFTIATLPCPRAAYGYAGRSRRARSAA